VKCSLNSDLGCTKNSLGTAGTRERINGSFDIGGYLALEITDVATLRVF